MYRYIKPQNISSLEANVAKARPPADCLTLPVFADQDTRLDCERRPAPCARPPTRLAFLSASAGSSLWPRRSGGVSTSSSEPYPAPSLQDNSRATKIRSGLTSALMLWVVLTEWLSTLSVKTTCNIFYTKIALWSDACLMTDASGDLTPWGNLKSKHNRTEPSLDGEAVNMALCWQIYYLFRIIIALLLKGCEK